jgi:putative hydrolase of the HAD superfamily
VTASSGPFSAVIFDVGGVFTDSPFAAVRDFAESIGAPEPLVTDIVFGGYGIDGDHPWHQVERGSITLEHAREQILVLGRAHGFEVDIWDVFMAMGKNGGGVRSELVAYVEQIRSTGLSTGIITNNVVEFKHHWRSMVRADELFDFVIDSCEVGVRKPSPAIFERALAIGGLAPGDAVFLDDYAANVAAAEAIGIRSILVDGDATQTIADLEAVLSSH